MRNFPNRTLSLILAVIFLFSAAAISFGMLLKGNTVLAENSVVMNPFPSFYDKNGNLLSTLSRNTEIGEFVIIIKDLELDSGKYNAGMEKMNQAKQELDEAQKELDSATTPEEKELAQKKVEQKQNDLKKVSFFATWNTDTFSKTSSTTVSFSEGIPLITQDNVGCEYTITIRSLIYTGKSNKLIMDILYPAGVMNESNAITRKLNETLEDVLDSTPSSSYYHDDDDDDDDDDSSSSVDIPPPTPNIIISEYSYGGGTVAAASSFELKVKFTNTSQKLPVDNIVMKVTVPEAFTLTSSSNTFYVDKMTRNSSVERTINLSVKPNADPISHPIKVSFSYEAVIDESRKQLTSEQEISIPVAQLDRFALLPVEMPSEIYAGEDTGISVTFINKGKTPVYNVTAEIEGNISQPGQRQFIGNLESGKEDSADFMIGALEEGEVSGEVIITYEDANMNVSELRAPFSAAALPMYRPPMDGEMTLNPEDMPAENAAWYHAVPVWGWMIGGVAIVIFASYLVKVIRRRRERKLEEQDEDF